VGKGLLLWLVNPATDLKTRKHAVILNEVKDPAPSANKGSSQPPDSADYHPNPGWTRHSECQRWTRRNTGFIRSLVPDSSGTMFCRPPRLRPPPPKPKPGRHSEWNEESSDLVVFGFAGNCFYTLPIMCEAGWSGEHFFTSIRAGFFTSFRMTRWLGLGGGLRSRDDRSQRNPRANSAASSGETLA
jgi:hypothetical protein